MTLFMALLPCVGVGLQNQRVHRRGDGAGGFQSLRSIGVRLAQPADLPGPEIAEYPP